MKTKNITKLLIGVVCIVLLIFVAKMALDLDSNLPDPIIGIFQTDPTDDTDTTEESPSPTLDDETTPQETVKPTVPSGEQVAPPEDLPSSVVIPSTKDPVTGESVGITFPCQVPEYGLVIEKMAPYNGMYVEDGTNANVENVAMLMVQNNGDYPVEYTQLSLVCGKETLLFDISALPKGERVVVQEKHGKSIPKGNTDSATALVVQRAEMDMSETMIHVTDNGDNTLTIQNLTNKTIPTVRVFYKHYMEDEALFVGGIAFTVRITRLGPGASVTIQPSHYTSQTSRVVMALTYDSEV